MKLQAIFCCALICGTGLTHAAEEVEFKQSGDFRARYFNDLNATGVSGATGQASDTTARLRYNLLARKGETLQAYASVLFNTEFGSQNSADGEFEQASADNLLLVNRAWASWKLTNSFSVKVGRFGIEMGDGSVFSENDWENVPTSHEGLQVAWDMDLFKVSGYAVKTNEYSQMTALSSPASGAVVGAPSPDPERNFYMISGDLKNLPDAVKIANIHFVQTVADAIHDNAASRGKDSWQHVGFTFAGEAAHVIYKASSAFQSGKLGLYTATTPTPSSADFSAEMMDFLVGGSFPEAAGLKMTAGYHRDTGNDDGAKQKQYQTLYYDRHDNAGLMNVVYWGNLTYWNVNVSVAPREDLETGVRYYMFSRTEKTASSTTTFGERFAELRADSQNMAQLESPIGSEIDAYVDKTFEANFKLGAHASMFLPSRFMKDGATAHNQTMSEAMVQGQMLF